MKRRMRKTILLLLILLLGGCNNPQSMENETVSCSFDEWDEEVMTMISSRFDMTGNWFLGDGVKVLEINENKDAGIVIFPIYHEDELLLLMSAGDSIECFDDHKVIDAFKETNRFLLIEAENRICFVSDDRMISLDGEMIAMSKDTERKIQKIRKNLIRENGMGKEKRLLMNLQPEQEGSDTGFRANNQLVVRFTDGNLEEKIGMFEEFCHGSLKYRYHSADIFVFEFEPLNSKALEVLLKKSNELDYVVSAVLSEKSDMDKDSPIQEAQ